MQIGDDVWVEVSRDRERAGIVSALPINSRYIEVCVAGVLQVAEKSKVRPMDIMPRTPTVEGATKNDSEKNRLELIPPEAIEAMGRAFTFGATKYDADNWRKGFDWRRLIGAAQRHINSFNAGEDKDPESGLSHIDHALSCLAILSAHEQKELGNDDRYKTKD